MTVHISHKYNAAVVRSNKQYVNNESYDETNMNLTDDKCLNKREVKTRF